MQNFRARIREDLERPILVGYRWMSLVLGTYLLLLIPLYLINEPGRSGIIQSCSSGAAAAVLFICHVLLRKDLVPPRHSQLAVAVGAGAILGQILVHMSLRGNLLLTTDVMLLMVPTALVLRDSRWFILGLGVTLVAWGAVVALNPMSGDLFHWIVCMISSTLVALVIHFHLRRVIRVQIDLRVQDHMREREKEQLIAWLSESLDNIKTLKGLIPICAKCKKVRNDEGFWEQVEHYVRQRTEAQFSHGVCPDCGREMLEELDREKA